MGQISPLVNLGLGIAFCVLGLVAAVLQTWLWTFPMTPDPSGNDPNGVTTAPVLWRMVHRLLGYGFLAIYLLLAFQMVPRFWQFESEAWSVGPIAHAIVGLGIGAILGLKIWILRRGQRFGKLLPYFGWGLVGMAFLTVSLVAKPVTRIQEGDFALTKEFTDSESATMRDRIYKNCTQCHGLSVAIARREENWMETLEEMAENAEKRGITDPSAPDRARMAEFLGFFLQVENDNHGRNQKGRDRKKKGDD